jgi:hypothetical protein
MKRLSKDLADKMVENVLTKIAKQDYVSSQFAKDSLDIMNNPIDNSVLTGILLSKARPSLFDDNEIDMRVTIMSSLQTVVSYRNDEGEEEGFDFNQDLAKEFSVTDLDKCSKSTKLEFALNQFVNAFYEYERLEKKYPELMKIM